jgi:hypothetical protein
MFSCYPWARLSTLHGLNEVYLALANKICYLTWIVLFAYMLSAFDSFSYANKEKRKPEENYSMVFHL